MDERLLKNTPVDADGVPIEAFRLTPGFIAFVGLMCLPAVAALMIFFGAWMVSSEVYAAEDASDAPASSSFGRPGETGAEVAGWKRTLVGICPVH
jgi:hypothetical protein